MYRTLSSRCFILALIVELPLSQAASTIQTFVDQNANFSFTISRSPGLDDFLSVQNEKDFVFMTIFKGGVSYFGDYGNRVLFTGYANEGQLFFVLRGVKLADAGRYTVLVPNMKPELVGEQTLIVKASPSKPQVVELNGPAVAGLDYHLNCSVRSNSEPPNHNLSMLSEWRRDSIPINSTGRYNVQGTELNITGINYGTDHGVRLTCFAFEDILAKSVKSDEYIIDVKYGPDNIQLSPSGGVITERENRHIIVNCTADCNPPCSFLWRKEFVSTSLSNNQTLIINNVSKTDTGQHLCSIKNNITGRSETAKITVTIIYGPASVQILSSPSEFPLKVEENTTVNINCSADCYPDCNFTWSGPQDFLKTGAHLSQVINRDKGGNYTCIATNLVNLGKRATVSVTVLVLYGPGNSINLGSVSPTVGVHLNQTAPDITCSAICNPPCEYRWYQNGTFYRNGATLSLGLVEKTTRGNYRCEACTSVLGVNRSASTSVNITVYYAPEVLLKPVILPRPSDAYIVKLGQTNVGLTCVVIDASPQVQQFIWTKDRQEIPTQTNQTLTIPMVTKYTMGKWGCKGLNSKGNPLESILDVDIHYGPIIINLPNLTKVEGESINVTCMVDSRPHPSSTSWTKFQNNTFTQDKAEMYIAHLNRADKGVYECTAVNTIQPTGVAIEERITVKSNYTLDVAYGAGILNLSVHDDGTVNENSLAIFQCRVDSNPPSSITWTKASNNTALKTESEVAQSLYRIDAAECLDMDNYTCSAYNGIGTPTNETVPFFVRCHPRTDFRLTLETKVYIKRHEGAVLRYAVISYPLPTFIWTFLGNGSESRGLPGSASQHNSGLQSELWFTSLGMDDFGHYSVIADNLLPPSAREVFEIISADVPEVPSNVMIVGITQTSVKVQWVAGNNGGPRQSFHIVASAGSLTKNVTAADPGYRQNGTAVLEGLVPKTKYIIYMLANNSVGSSNMTEAIIITTLEDSNTDVPYLPLSAIAGGIGAGLVVILLVVVALFLWRRYQHLNKHSDDIKQDITERPRPESGLVDNPVYDSSGHVPGSSINNDATGVEYAEVVKPKKKASKMEVPSNEYAQVEKTKKNRKKAAEKGNHGNTSKGDIYENADLMRKRPKPENVYQNSVNAKAEPCGENVYEDPGAATSSVPLKNNDGLLYADLMLDPPTTKNGKYVIRSIENRTEYAEIAYGKRGEPLPDSDREKENSDTAKRADQ